MKFIRITTRARFREWLALTDDIYANHRATFIPPIRQSLTDLFRASLRPDARIGFYAVTDASDRIRARTTIHDDPDFDRRSGQPVQLFGFTEFVDDLSVSRCLFDGLRATARSNGRTRILGPANLLPNEYGGVVLSGFGQRGFLDSAYNRDYYAWHYRQAGFAPRFRSETLICNLGPDAPDPRQVLAFDDERLGREGLEVRYCDRANLPAQVEMLRELLNDCFAERPYYTPILASDMQRRMADLAHVMDDRLLAYLTRRGQPIGFAVFLPDISEFLMRAGGDLGLLNRLRLLATRSGYRREAIGVVTGVRPTERGKGYSTLLMRTVFGNMISAGYRRVRSTFIETNNPAAAALFKKMGAERLHELAFFEQRLDPEWCDGVIAAAAAARRAPSAHNTQPWSLTCQRDRVRLDIRHGRTLPLSDPDGRDLCLSLGAFAEALLIAGSDIGAPLAFKTDIDLSVGRAGWFLPSETPYRTEFDIAALARRRTSRGALASCELGGRLLGDLDAQTGETARLCVAKGSTLRDLLIQSERRFFEDRATVGEFRNWFRPTQHSPQGDGLTGACLGLSRLGAIALWHLTSAWVHPLVCRMGAPGLLARAAAANLSADAPVLALIARSAGPSERIDVGRAMLRVWLKLAGHGIYVHPMSTILDRASTRAELSRRLGLLEGETVECLFRVGTGHAPPVSPRIRPLISFSHDAMEPV